MCDFWKTTDKDDLAVNTYERLPRNLRVINITGGEPFVRRDLVDVVRMIHKTNPRAYTVISTNGFLTERILEWVGEVRKFNPDIGIGVSFDGIGETHDKIRGYPGAFKRCVKTLEGLKNLGMTNLRVGMTISSINQNEVGKVYEFAQEMGVPFTGTFAHSSDVYFGEQGKDNSLIQIQESTAVEDALAPVIDGHLRSMRPKDWYRAWFFDEMVRQARGDGIRFTCPAGDKYFFMDPKGNIYTCNILNEKMGNIRDLDRFDQIYSLESYKKARNVAAHCERGCWMVCNIRPWMKEHMGLPTGWVMREKIKAHIPVG